MTTGTGDPTNTSTADPSGTTADPTTGGAESSSGSSGAVDSSTGPVDMCGNDMIDGDESCDG
ncbi:MAG: ABC transporter permease, partial [Deltaproteobacteria bacterium]|nr:ABC transporter permease [Deltaproteobacteria bacterium]